MKGACVFIFFMISNAILGVCGIGLLVIGILFILGSTLTRRLNAVPRNLESLPDSVAAIIVLMVIGAYITAIFILGTCSKNRRRVLIAYFVLILILVIVDIAMTVFFNRLFILNPRFVLFKISTIIFGVSTGVGFINFILALIYFILIGRENNPQLDAEVRNMEYINIPENQLV